MEVRQKVIVLSVLCIVYSLPQIWFFLVGGEEYAMLSLGILCFAALSYFTHKGTIRVNIDKIDILFVCFISYCLFNVCLPLDVTTLSRTFSLVGIWFFFRNLPRKDYGVMMVQWGIILSSVVQAAVAIMQQFGVWNSLHAHFPATGAFGNPGPLGGYLALGMTILFLRFVRFGTRSRCEQVLIVMCAVILLCAIVIADSRASWFAVSVAAGVCCFRRRRKRKTKSIKFMALSACFLTLQAIAFICYRPDSVFARLTIWKVSLLMFCDAPVFGNGTGSFLRRYMDKQTEYLSGASTFIKREADDVSVAYNEILGVLVEQGLVGFCLLMAFMIFLCATLWKRDASEDEHSFLYALISVLCFSLFSYPSSIPAIYVPVVVMLALTPMGKGMNLSKRYVRSFATLNLTFLVFCFFCNLSFWTYLDRYRSLETTPTNIFDHKPVPWFVRHNPICLTSMADAQIAVGDQMAIIITCGRLVQYHNKSQWYMALGDANAQLGRLKEADAYYGRVCTMRLGLVEPFYARFLLWIGEDSERSVSIARHVLSMPAKIENSETRAMRESVYEFLQRI